jgi:hypothetical protein
VKIHSIAIEAPEGKIDLFFCLKILFFLTIDNGPKTVKLFVNRPAIDFNDSKNSEAVQTIE